ncbi:MAG: hypothetical protein H7245_23085 [Candidatus Saccharibacteria bacterium]|nr:hypothetical protein [Pseudorhodobacter sp.]
MITNMTELRRKATQYAVVVVWAMLPLAAGIGYALGTGGLAELAMLALIALVVTLEWRRNAAGLGTQMAASAALAVGVATLVYMMRGHAWQADSHMIFFAAFALTAVFCDWRPIVTYAAVIAVHHLVLNFALTEAVFPGEASLGRVLLHAVILIVQAVPLIWLATVLAGLFTHSRQLWQETDQARENAEFQSRTQEIGRDEVTRVVATVEGAMVRLARGDTTVRLMPDDLPARYASVGETFNVTVGALSAAFHEVEVGAQGLLTSSDRLADTARHAADQASQQSVTVEQSAVSIHHLTVGVQATTALAAEADAMMSANRKEAEAGGTVLEQAGAAMHRIEESSHQISRISAVMEDIAFQTNLLALNAGVEAARAGDLGRGFAVVASEVRELSQRAGDATKDIRTLVSDSRKNVARGAELVGKTSESLGALIKGAGTTATIVSEIASKMRDQTTGLNALAANIVLIEKNAQAGAQVAQQSLTMGVRLNEEASAMIGAVNAFRRGQAEDRPRMAAE